MTPVNIPELLEAQTWTFAKTMPRNPHFWSVKKDWPDEDSFNAAVNHIRENGVIKEFYGQPYTVFYHNGFRYWTMGAPLEKTYLINRAEVDESDQEALASMAE